MDEIQRKLALIDEQLAGGGLHRRLVSTAPLLFPAVGLIAGIVVQDRLLRPLSGTASCTALWLWLAMLGVVAGAAGVHLLRCRKDLRPEGFACTTLLAFTCLGGIRLAAYEQADPRDIRNRVGRDRVLATVGGRVLTEPSQERQDWCFAELVPADPSSTFYLKLDRVRTSAGWQPVVGTIRMQVDEPVPHLKPGDYIQAYCWLHRFEAPTNPGQFDLAGHLQRRNVVVGASVPAREAIEVRDESPRNLRLRVRSGLAEFAARGLLGHPAPQTQSEAMLAALLLGARRSLDRSTSEAFRRTGLLHLVSLSGMHLSILIGLVWWSCKPAGFSKRVRAAICSAATAVFLLVVPPLGPILRAAVIAWAYCASILLRRRSHGANSLALAALVLLLFQPTELFDAGWQLSFACVAGILAFTRRIEGFIHTRTHDRLRPPGDAGSPAWDLLRRLGPGIIQALSVGTAAWLASAGILLYHFYNLTPLAAVWTLLAAPFVTATVVLGLLKILLAFFLPTLSFLLGTVLGPLADALIGLVKIMARIDFSYLAIGHVPLLLIVLYYVLILFAGFVHLRRPGYKSGLCTALALLLVVPLGLMKWQRTHRDDLRLTCLDVGHGQAILAQLPGTRNLLFDAGSLYNKDVGARIVVPFLDYTGLGRLEVVVASHHDVDHINGIPEVVDLRSVKHVYLGDTFFAPALDSRTAGLLTAHLAAVGRATERVPETIAAGPARVRRLWPAGALSRREEFSENDSSLVCLIEFAGRRVLLCSDIEEPAQREILKRYPSLQVDVVVAPHHGSTRTLDEGFLEQLAPGLVVCSCGRTDYERGRVLRKVTGTQLMHTAAAGAITIRIDGAGMVHVQSLMDRK
jgi:competence protein ComEC